MNLKFTLLLSALLLLTEREVALRPINQASEAKCPFAFRELTGPPQFLAGAIVNHGTFKITDTTVTYGDTFTNHGAYLSDPSTNNFTTLIIGPGGYLVGGTGDKFVVKADMLNGSLQSTAWSTVPAELSFRNTGSTAHTMSLAGRDMGASYFGMIGNFAWDTLRLRAGESLTLTDGNATPGAAFYTDSLILEGGLAQIASITGNSFNIYYNPWAPANAWLLAQTWPLTGRGSIIPMQAALDITAVHTLPNGHVLLNVLGAPLRTHRILVSIDLFTFDFLGTAVAAADGTFTFEDPDSSFMSRRYYKVVFP